tara:strand:+ start:42 stop:491 length:450 start_codon:yes stop_codon:yes gene_type:complete
MEAICTVTIKDIDIPLSIHKKLQKIQHSLNEGYHYKLGGGEKLFKWRETKVLEYSIDIEYSERFIRVSFGNELSIHNLTLIEKILGQKVTKVDSGSNGIYVYFSLPIDKRKQYCKNLKECKSLPNPNHVDTEYIDRNGEYTSNFARRKN